MPEKKKNGFKGKAIVEAKGLYMENSLWMKSSHRGHTDAHFIKHRMIQPSAMTLDGFKYFMNKMQTGKGIVRMRLDVDSNILEGLGMEFMGDDTDYEEDAGVSIYKLRTLIIYIIYDFITIINLNSDDSCIRIL